MFLNNLGTSALKTPLNLSTNLNCIIIDQCTLLLKTTELKGLF